MKKRVAKKVAKNQEVLNYNKGQVNRAQTVVARAERKASKNA
ncbi:hypothetical protein V6R21_30795 [Limibacter armeniacum]